MAAPKTPRIRKTAPTVRQRVERAQELAQKPKKNRRVRPNLAPLARPFKKIPRPRTPNNKFGRIISKILYWITPRYFINSWREVRQVSWPGRGETWRLTGAVFVFAAIFGGAVAGVDKVLDIIFKNLVLK